MTKTTQPPTTSGGRVIAFLILSVISVAIFLAGLVLGIEPRLVMERAGDRIFRVTVINLFSGKQFYTRTIEGVSDVIADDAVRDDRLDSAVTCERSSTCRSRYQ